MKRVWPWLFLGAIVAGSLARTVPHLERNLRLVSATPEGISPESDSDPWDTTSEESTEDGSPRVVPSPLLAVGVSDPEGRPIAGARITAAVSRDCFRTRSLIDAQSDDRGVSRLDTAENAWAVVNVWAEGRTPKLLCVTGEEALGDLEVRLPPASPLRGVVVTREGRPASDIRLRFEPLIHQQTLPQRIASQMGLVDSEIVTDAEGRFTAPSLRDGDYRVVFVDTPSSPALLIRAEAIRNGSVILTPPW